MAIAIQRIYDIEKKTGLRILVDRLWPRGVRKEEAGIYAWFREVAPSSELRKTFHHDPEKFQAFREAYLNELKGNPELQGLLEICRANDVVLLYSASDRQHNNAVVLMEVLEKELDK